MKVFVMALGLVAIAAAPALAQYGGGPAAAPRSITAGGTLVVAQAAGTPQLEMVADTMQPGENVRGMNQGLGTDTAVRLVPGPGHIQWRFDPPADFYQGGN